MHPHQSWQIHVNVVVLRRTCRSGEWRAGRIWRRWVTHLSWITSRGQHLLVQSHDPAKNCRTNQQGAAILLETFASNQSKKNTSVSFSRSTWEAQLFSSQQHCTENKPISDGFRKPVFGITYYFCSVYTVHSVCAEAQVTMEHNTWVSQNAMHLNGFFYTSSLDGQKMKNSHRNWIQNQVMWQ